MCADPESPAPPACPPRPVRLLVCDLDGTLLDAQGTVAVGLPDALAVLERAGVPLALCTGRPHAAAHRLAAAAGLHPAVIASYHGALVVDERTGRCLRHLTIPWRCVDGIAALFSACGLELTLYAGLEVWPADADPPPCVTRLLAVGTDAAVDAALERSRTIAGPAVRIERPRARMLDVRHVLATKDEGLRAVAKAMDVPLTATAAAGDDVSDVAMLQRAGWGVAVGAPGGAAAHAGDVAVAQEDLAGYLRSLVG